MLRRTFITLVASAGTSLAARNLALASDVATPSTEGDDMPQTAPQTGYAPVNDLQMYYEIHGSGGETPSSGGGGLGGEPVVLLHGAYMSTGAMGFLTEELANSRQVIVTDLQGHGRTADVDRPLTYEQMADDVAALMDHLGVARADVVGYSMGGGAALQLAIRHPERVRKLVAISAGYRLDGMYPEVIAGIAEITPEVFMGTPWYDEFYAAVAPNPEDFPALVEKLKQLDAAEFDWSEEIRGITAPALLVYGDADVLRPEHMVELFQLLGGGVPGDLTGLPRARLAILPGTTHVTVMQRGDWLLPMLVENLDEPVSEES
jgi:pimeloyl-ACP methyl ester carboxylesterase